VEDVNALESKITKLNDKIASIKRKHNPEKKIIVKDKYTKMSQM